MAGARSQAARNDELPGIPIGQLRLVGVSARSETKKRGQVPVPKLYAPRPSDLNDYYRLWGPRGKVTYTIKGNIQEGTLTPALVERLRSKRAEIRREGALYAVQQARFQAGYIDPLHVCAAEYNKECQRLGQGEPGKRARDILFDFLSSEQRRDAERLGYFEVTILPAGTSAKAQELAEDGYGIQYGAARFRILRYSTDVIQMVREDGRWGGKSGNVGYSVCLHPIQPYPLDDIALSQFIELTTDPDGFAQTMNTWVQGYNFGGMSSMFRADDDPPEELVMPFLSHRAAADLSVRQLGRRLQAIIEGMYEAIV